MSSRTEALRPESAPVPRRGPRWHDTFACLSYRNYRLLWIGTLISSSGDWMDQIALNWLVLTLTDSALYLGLVNLARAVPILIFTMIGGVAADRFERRKVLFTTQFVAMVLAFILAALVWTEQISISVIVLIAVGRGIMMSFNQPARQSLIPDLVPRSVLMNAIAINSATMNATRVIGPAIGGLLIARVGVGGAFFVNGLTFIGVLVSLAMMSFPTQTRPRTKAPPWQSLREGLQYIAQDGVMIGLVLLIIVPLVLGMPYLALLTVFARDVLRIGPEGLGWLLAMSGIGSVLGALSIASLGDFRRRGLLMLGLMVAFGVFLTLFALSTTPWLSFPLAILMSGSNTAAIALNNTLLQIRAADEYRGRVNSLTFLQRGLVPLGTTGAGFSVEVVGPALTVAAMGLLIVIIVIGIALRWPALRRVT